MAEETFTIVVSEWAGASESSINIPPQHRDELRAYGDRFTNWINQHRAGVSATVSHNLAEKHAIVRVTGATRPDVRAAISTAALLVPRPES